MEQTFILIRKRARRIVSRSPHPDFYSDFSEHVKTSLDFFKSNPVIAELRAYAEKHLENDFGHGLKHAEKVTLDAGALMLIECGLAGYSDEVARRQILTVQCAGLLHDIMRKEKDHAVKGAVRAAEILRNYPVSKDEIEDVRLAIRNHEAFKTTEKPGTAKGRLVSDCLYDADKFRWGPDNFEDTVWDMVSFSKISLPRFMALYPRGIRSLERIKSTFRTATGKKYGPQFIDIGIAIGAELFEIIENEFAKR